MIVTYNSRDLIAPCLEQIYGRPNIEIVIVDNASKDGTVDFISSQYPGVNLVDSRENLGFAKGNNLGFRHCTHENVLLLNPDAFLRDATQLGDLIEVLQSDPNIAIVGPQLKNVDGSHQVGDAGFRDTILATAGHMLLMHRLFARMPSMYVTNPKLLARQLVDVDWICGACLLTKKSVIDAYGGLDERIFMYGEDVEWGERVRRQGRRVVYVPKVEVLHLQGASQRQQDTTFFSTKWLDQRSRKWAGRSRVGFEMFRTICFVGFYLKYLLLMPGDRNKPQGRASAMRRYAQHVFNWRYGEIVPKTSSDSVR